ncbi:GAF domain-containing protein [Massilia sp. R2A-15]|uniref:GAF domain-containing protein n=1 Tax=Massilia sp. R2A-15 TaxID=3064278 RepID=UPI0027332C32|nr:GAF domain-containing protein [Massilia sp. R2A-15]WLI88401.1 GAF domain-containing protein [Massilia sp. R2A-15]
MTLKIDAIRACFEGVIPGTMATADLDGTPNISYLSQVQYVDSEHVALTYQFFNKTRQNLLVNPHALLTVIDPFTAAQYRLRLQFLRTETSGPLFESMKAKLAGIASHVGMSHVFQLRGADVFRVNALEQVPGRTLPAPPPRRNLLSALRSASDRIRPAGDLGQLLGAALDCLATEFDIGHAMALLYDDAGQRLYTLASRGYADSGVGSEIALGDGVIGVAARERTPIRISHMTSEYAYGRAIRDSAAGGPGALELAIPLPGLAESRSQMAVPMIAGARLVGVLYVESPHDLRFSYDDEDALVALAAQLALAIRLVQADAVEDAPAADSAPAQPAGEPVAVRHYPENDSVFLDDDYLIKGVAGSIFSVLVHDCVEKGRTEFSNRELRLDPRIRLPDISDNLDARLLLLSRRLADRSACVRIEKTGRGRFKLCLARPLRLADP